ncbi:DUF1295 domain-containing protein [Crossiella sp. CA-258035]|uniref:DUF1295 domain-containing protein n=1 Tax=Crossiella sp. CA-258035 TaxID=2981138 RepID=UPI0024BBEDE7|nr:DUF1295 domain-containing protein [Crossiella sp. CA-258035]WHT21046.1 DUF1295 domain-containing protein [Crossiella sp. CA-258035]
MSPFALNLLVSLGVLVLLLAATFLISVARRRYDIIDSFWGAGFAAVALVSFALSAGHGVLWQRVLVTGLTVVWGLRLAWHILRRNLGQPEDQRYVELMARATGNPLAHLATRVYLPQGAVLWFVSLPVQAAQYVRPELVPLTVLGVLVWLTGFGFEAVGDRQLARFKGDPANRGKVMDRGLWRFTRHPNYFGDAAVWWGLYLLACHSWLGAATVLSPLLMTYVLTKRTGKALLERHLLDSRPGYRDYVRRTSGFFPLPPKKV